MNKNNNKEQKDKAMQGRMRKKSGIAFLIAIVMVIILIIRVIVINVSSGERYSQIVLNHQAYTSDRITAKRGEILDRNGMVLAYSKKVYNLLIDPERIASDNEKYKAPLKEALMECFNYSGSDLENAVNENTSNRYKKILSDLTEDQIKKFKEIREKNLNIASVAWFEDDYVRTYPFNNLACDVIGFSTTANGGEIGLEKQYNNVLTGVDGLKYNYVEENLETNRALKPAQDGQSIVTTIDYGVQNIIEKYIREYNSRKPSANTAVVVADPNSGEILGMASYPDFNLNNPRDLTVKYKPEEINKMTDVEKTNALYSIWNNYCVSQIYEPGSTFKSFTVAGALEENLTRDGEKFFCGGSTQVANYVIKCWRAYQGGHGALDLEEALGDSCNVVLMELGKRLGAQDLVKYQRLFGFGSRTGIDLPGEERGIILDPDHMSDVDVATNSFGQSLNVNMVQMIGAYSSLINGGYYYQPHMVKEIKNSNGETVRTVNPTVLRQTVTAETSATIKKFLKAGVDKYAVQYSKVDGYSIGGKTATAEKLPRSDKKWVVSVMSFAPVENPKFLLYVLIDEPYGTTGGEGDGSDSQSLTKSILTELLPYLGVQKEGTTTDASNSSSETGGNDGQAEGVEVPDTQSNVTVPASNEFETEPTQTTEYTQPNE